ncbi:hypothetical protein ACHQM5_028960 [Ranunculus cassubicifolius]
MPNAKEAAAATDLKIQGLESTVESLNSRMDAMDNSLNSRLDSLNSRMDEMENRFNNKMDQLFEALTNAGYLENMYRDGHKEFISTIPAHPSNGHKEFISTIPMQNLSPSDYMLAGDLVDETELSDTGSVPAQSDNSAPVTQQEVAITMAPTAAGLGYSADSGIEEYVSLLFVKLPCQTNLQFSHLLALDNEHYCLSPFMATGVNDRDIRFAAIDIRSLSSGVDYGDTVRQRMSRLVFEPGGQSCDTTSIRRVYCFSDVPYSVQGLLMGILRHSNVLLVFDVLGFQLVQASSVIEFKVQIKTPVQDTLLDVLRVAAALNLLVIRYVQDRGVEHNHVLQSFNGVRCCSPSIGLSDYAEEEYCAPLIHEKVTDNSAMLQCCSLIFLSAAVIHYEFKVAALCKDMVRVQDLSVRHSSTTRYLCCWADLLVTVVDYPLWIYYNVLARPASLSQSYVRRELVFKFSKYSLTLLHGLPAFFQTARLVNYFSFIWCSLCTGFHVLFVQSLSARICNYQSRGLCFSYHKVPSVQLLEVTVVPYATTIKLGLRQSITRNLHDSTQRPAKMAFHVLSQAVVAKVTSSTEGSHTMTEEIISAVVPFSTIILYGLEPSVGRYRENDVMPHQISMVLIQAPIEFLAILSGALCAIGKNDTAMFIAAAHVHVHNACIKLCQSSSNPVESKARVQVDTIAEIKTIHSVASEVLKVAQEVLNAAITRITTCTTDCLYELGILAAGGGGSLVSVLNVSWKGLVTLLQLCTGDIAAKVSVTDILLTLISLAMESLKCAAESWSKRKEDISSTEAKRAFVPVKFYLINAVRILSLFSYQAFTIYKEVTLCGLMVLTFGITLSKDTRLKASSEALTELLEPTSCLLFHTLLNTVKMKKGVRIINIARGGVIDENALVRALDSGIVAQAALDVFTVTPHLGASTKEAQGVAIEIAEAVVRALNGELSATAVNAPFVILAKKLGRLASQHHTVLQNQNCKVRLWVITWLRGCFLRPSSSYRKPNSKDSLELSTSSVLVASDLIWS